MKKPQPKFRTVHVLTGVLGAVALATFACGEEAPPPLVVSNNVNGTSSQANGQPPAASSFVGAPVPPSPSPAQPTVAVTPSATASPQPTGAVSGAPSVSARPMPGDVPTSTVPPVMTTAVVTPPPPPATSSTTEEEPPAPSGEGNALTPNIDGWVGPTTNGVGVQGSWYGYQDEATTGCCEDKLTVEAGKVCMSGTVGQADPENYDIYGAGMGFTFNDADPWDGSAYSGVSFTAEVDAESDVIVKLKMATTTVVSGGDHLAPLTAGNKSFSWSDFEQPAWVIDAGDDTAFDPSDIEAIQIQVNPGEAASNAFTVCISGLVVDE